VPALFLCAGLTIYLFTGAGSYDLPGMARSLGANRAAAEKVGVWKDEPPAPAGALAMSDFWRLADGIKTMPTVPKVAEMTSEEAARHRKSIKSQVAQAKVLAATENVAWRTSKAFATRYEQLRAGGRLLGLEAELAARAGDADGLLDALRSALNLARLSASSQRAEGVMTAASIEAGAQSAAARCVGSRPEIAVRLAAIFAKPGWTPDARLTVRAEEFDMRRVLEEGKYDAFNSTSMFNLFNDMFDQGGSHTIYPSFPFRDG
jgi:hypothetical protein